MMKPNLTSRNHFNVESNTFEEQQSQAGSNMTWRENALKQENRFKEHYTTFQGPKKLDLDIIHRENPQILEIRETLKNPQNRSDMLSKATIRPNLKAWNRQNFSKKDLEEDIKLQVPGNLGIPLLPIHKMCTTEKNKIR